MRAPLDDGNTALSVAVTDGGEVVWAWTSPERLPFGDFPLRAHAASGTIDGRVGPATPLGCACRTVNGIRAVVTASGPAVAFTDNETALVAGTEIAQRGGRVHVAVPSASPAGAAPPGLTASARPRTLGYDQPLSIRVRCDRACDVRAVVGPRVRRRGALGIGVGSLPRAGTRTLLVRPSTFRTLAPRHPGPVAVLVRAYAPDGSAFTQRVIRIELRRKPVTQLPAPADVTARRSGRRIVVTWTYPRYPDNHAFIIGGRRDRNSPPVSPRLGFEYVQARPYRRHRRVVLRPERPSVVRFVGVLVERLAPQGRREVVVPVTG